MQNRPKGHIQPAEGSLSTLWALFKEDSSALPDLLGSFSKLCTSVIVKHYHSIITLCNWNFYTKATLI